MSEWEQGIRKLPSEFNESLRNLPKKHHFDGPNCLQTTVFQKGRPLAADLEFLGTDPCSCQKRLFQNKRSCLENGALSVGWTYPARLRGRLQLLWMDEICSHQLEAMVETAGCLVFYRGIIRNQGFLNGAMSGSRNHKAQARQLSVTLYSMPVS